MAGKLEGRVAIVTGSGQGIGKGIAIGLAREGAKIVTNNRAPKEESLKKYDRASMPEEDWNQLLSLAGDAETTAAQIISEGNEAVYYYGDVSKPEDAEALVKKAIDTWGRVDIVVNNAAGLGSGSIVDLTSERWDYLTVPKLKGTFNLMHYAVPYMIEQKFGRILNGSSDAWTGLPDNDAYSASNAGLVGLTYAAAKELLPHGITVNAYCPQGTSPGHAVEFNKMVRRVKALTGKDPDPERMKDVEADHGDPVNLAPILAYLCTDMAAEITGEVFSIKASGKIDRYCVPERVTHVQRPAGSGFLWEVDELDEVFKKTLLGEGYVSHATRSSWGKRERK